MSGFLKKFERSLRIADKGLAAEFAKLSYGAHVFICDDVFELATSMVDELGNRDAIPKNQIFMPASPIILQYRDIRPMECQSPFGQIASAKYGNSDGEVGQFLLISGETGRFLPQIEMRQGVLFNRGGVLEPSWRRIGVAHLETVKHVPEKGRWSILMDTDWSMFLRALQTNNLPSDPRVLMSLRDEFLESNVFYATLAAMLIAVINTPKHFGRKERKLGSLISGRSGSFPYLGCTEIFLNHKEDGELTDIRQPVLSGRKCLHFVRSFTRVRNGNLEIVSPHWRGDASLGVKSSRYVVQ